MITSNTTRRDLIIAALMLLAAGLLYWFLQQGFYIDRMKVKGVGFSTNLKGDVIELRFTDPKFGDQDLKNIDSVSLLRALDLQGSSVTEQGLSHLRGCQKLERLNLSGMQVTDEGMRQVSMIPNLKHLYLEESEITDEGLQHLVSLTKLERLNIKGCEGITTDGLAVLGQLSALKTLNFKGVPITLAEYRIVEKSLSEIYFAVDIDLELELDETSPLEVVVFRETGDLYLYPRRFNQNTFPPTPAVTVPPDYVITADLLNRIPEKHRIVSLQNNSGLPITREAILSLRQFPNLTGLSLVSRIDAQTLQVIAALSKLEGLSLELPLELKSDSENYEFTHADIASLAQLKNLRSLSLTLPNTDPKVFSALQLLPKLRGLDLKGNHLADEDILFLQNMKKLEWISLRDNQLTDASVEVLKELPNLLGVDLVESSISLREISTLSQRLKERKKAIKAAAIVEENQSSQDVDD